MSTSVAGPTGGGAVLVVVDVGAGRGVAPTVTLGSPPVRSQAASSVTTANATPPASRNRRRLKPGGENGSAGSGEGELVGVQIPIVGLEYPDELGHRFRQQHAELDGVLALDGQDGGRLLDGGCAG